ncbi:MAG TPA: PAS domain-containing protein [Acidimicrobiales bacterium]
MQGGTGQKALTLILARELASNLATPMFVIDARGYLVFYNDAAEGLIGKPFAEIGEIAANDWGAMLDLSTESGEPLDTHDTPPAVAYYHHRPAHDALVVTALDGTRRHIEVTAYPLFAKPEEVEGVLAIFWEAGTNEGGA